MPAGSQPNGPIKVVEVKFKYLVADEWLEAMVETNGVEAPREWTFEASLDEVDPEFRLPLKRAFDYYNDVRGFPEFSAPPTDVESFLEKFEGWARDLETTDGERSPFDDERNVWIAHHGSEHLKRAWSRGYKVNRTYAEERLERDFPNAWLDTGGSAEWRERTDPTSDALDLEVNVQEWIDNRPDLVGLEARIVWMLEPPPDLSDAVESRHGYFAQQEVVIVPEYLGRYTVIIPVSEAIRSLK